eukprot:8156291-Ditylum_brightwellii.AAC.1
MLNLFATGASIIIFTPVLGCTNVAPTLCRYKPPCPFLTDSNTSTSVISIKLTCIDIYNDDIHDLLHLSPTESSSSEGAEHNNHYKDTIKIIDNLHDDNGVIIKGIVEKEVHTAQEVLGYMKEASFKQST